MATGRLRELIDERRKRGAAVWAHASRCPEHMNLRLGPVKVTTECEKCRVLMDAWVAASEAVHAWRADAAIERAKETGVLKVRGHEV
jgi:hypothetical protein